MRYKAKGDDFEEVIPERKVKITRDEIKEKKEVIRMEIEILNDQIQHFKTEKAALQAHLDELNVLLK